MIRRKYDSPFLDAVFFLAAAIGCFHGWRPIVFGVAGGLLVYAAIRLIDWIRKD